MYKRKDSDIFGTANIGYAPRIENHTYIDPNAAFKKKTEDNYENYSSKIHSIPQTITAKPFDASNVNEKANFQDDYHKNRKQKDLQSSIFYEPITITKQQKDFMRANSQNIPSNHNKNQEQKNYGRKETFKRQINDLPYNNFQIKGNSSRLFDLDQRIMPKSQETIQLAPLIPHQMKWDQHDSKRYSHLNQKKVQKSQCPQINEISLSTSTVLLSKQENPKQSNEISHNNKIKKDKQTKNEKKSSKVQTKIEANIVEIKIIKGWNAKFMEGLSKHCKLNNSAIIKFEIEDEQKVNLTLKKSQRWQNVTDWLRKDCKLKIRVNN